HQALPNLGKDSRESPLGSDESGSEEERVRTAGMHMIPPNDLAPALGVLVLEVIIDK
ncbi:hypothetical protein KI387_024646, partial [Taxus chinensis]